MSNIAVFARNSVNQKRFIQQLVGHNIKNIMLRLYYYYLFYIVRLTFLINFFFLFLNWTFFYVVSSAGGGTAVDIASPLFIVATKTEIPRYQVNLY